MTTQEIIIAAQNIHADAEQDKETNTMRVTMKARGYKAAAAKLAKALGVELLPDEEKRNNHYWIVGGMKVTVMHFERYSSTYTIIVHMDQEDAAPEAQDPELQALIQRAQEGAKAHGLGLVVDETDAATRLTTCVAANGHVNAAMEAAQRLGIEGEPMVLASDAKGTVTVCIGGIECHSTIKGNEYMCTFLIPKGGGRCAYRYYSTYRPITPGSCPQNGILNMKNFQRREYCEAIDRDAWGYIDYDHRLSSDEMSRYELLAG